MASIMIGTKTFEHVTFENANGYLLVNRKCDDIDRKASLIARMFRFTYPNLRDIEM